MRLIQAAASFALHGQPVSTNHNNNGATPRDLLADMGHEIDPEGHTVDVDKNTFATVSSSQAIVKSPGNIFGILSSVAEK
jgi:hypothetical protein